MARSLLGGARSTLLNLRAEGLVALGLHIFEFALHHAGSGTQIFWCFTPGVALKVCFPALRHELHSS